MPVCGYEFYLLVFNSISHEWAQRTSEISSWTLEDKIRIHARACNILSIYNYSLKIEEGSIFKILLRVKGSGDSFLDLGCWACTVPGCQPDRLCTYAGQDSSGFLRNPRILILVVGLLIILLFFFFLIVVVVQGNSLVFNFPPLDTSGGDINS